MQQLFETGRAIDLVFAFVAVEFIALAWWRHARGGGLNAKTLALALLPGVMLLAALRLALTQAPWQALSLVLLLALLAHLADLWRRMSAARCQRVTRPRR